MVFYKYYLILFFKFKFNKNFKYKNKPCLIKYNYNLIKFNFFKNNNKLLKFNNNLHKNNFYFFYLNYCFESLFKNKFFIKIDNDNFYNYYIINNLNFFKNQKKLIRFFEKNFKILNPNLFLKIFINSLIKKDVSILLNWLIVNIENTNLKNHKKFISVLRNFILENESKIINFFNIKGIFFDIRGKVGVAGNSKKRHFSFYIGNIKYSSKCSKMDFQQGIIKTYTGCLGLTLILSY